MKPVNKTRRTTEHSGMIEETRVYCRNARRIIRVSEKRSSRKADRVASKIMIKEYDQGHDEFECGHDEYDHELEYEPIKYYPGYMRWKYCKSPRITIREFTHLPWWVLIGKVRYQEGFRTWYR